MSQFETQLHDEVRSKESVNTERCLLCFLERSQKEPSPLTPRTILGATVLTFYYRRFFIIWEIIDNTKITILNAVITINILIQ